MPVTFLLPLGVAEDKAKVGGPAAQGPAGAGVGEGGAEEVHLRPVLAQIDGQPGLVLAAPGAGHVGLGEGFAVLGQGVLPDGLLLGPGPVAADRDDRAHASHGGEKLIQHHFGSLVETHLGLTGADGGEVLRGGLLRQGMGAVDQIQRTFHASTASPMRRSSRGPNSRPMLRIMLG